MSHQVSSIGFRLGKTLLWNNNVIFPKNNNKIFNNQLNTSYGLQLLVNQLIYKKKYRVVKILNKTNIYSNFINISILYYPMLNTISRRKNFPLYLNHRKILAKSAIYSTNFNLLLKNLWDIKYKKFGNRFVKSRLHKNLNKWLSKSMFKGTNTDYNFFKTKTKLNLKTLNLRKNLTFKTYYLRRQHKKYLQKLNPKLIAKQIEKRTGLKVYIRVKNVFDYISIKSKKFRLKTSQNHIWNKKFLFNKKRYTSYYDIVNSFFISSAIQKSEPFLMKMIQYSLLKMHKRRIRPKTFFYFLDSIIKNMKQLTEQFYAFRIIITGKLMGGTSRTKSFSIGFGVLPFQSISKNIHYELGDIISKYGSFGIKLFTWRKEDKEIRW